MKIERDKYLNQLIKRKHSGMIKIVSGVRRCGKSFLLFKLFKEHLLEAGVAEDHIICTALDSREEQQYRDPDVYYAYVKSRILDEEMYYVLLDEVQMMDDFASVLNGLMRIDNLDIYVTGSNSRFLTSDVVTEFRGRGEEVRVFPLSFAEFYSTKERSWHEAWREYMVYGGMPHVLTWDEPEQKMKYLQDLFLETYLRDIIERNGLKREEELEELVRIVASGIGGLLNPHKLANIFASVKHAQLSAPTIKLYLDHLQNAFIINKAERYDIKGKQYINSPFKYYFVDPGLRNACIRFRQIEETHLMENIIYNELMMRGYQVDVGVIGIDRKDKHGNRERKMLEVDFVANKGSARFYIQSAYAIPTREKREQEERSLLAIRGAFQKVLIVGDAGISHYDDNGVLILKLEDFLLSKDHLIL